MTDADQPGEELDEAAGGGYPPDRPQRLDDDGGFVPEAWDQDPPDQGGVELVGDPDVGAPDDEAELVGELADRDRDVGPLAPDDEFTGDETTRDIVTERQPMPAEEAAVRIDDDPEA